MIFMLLIERFGMWLLGPKQKTIAPELVQPPKKLIPLQVMPPQPKKNMLDVFCTAIRDFEGSPGDLNYKNNNPGNCRCSPVGYAAQYGDVRCSDNFSVFPTYDLGWQYLENLVHQRALLHPQWTIQDFFNNYAPTGDQNNPTNYAHNVAGKCGVLVTTTLKELFA